jgi:hypothetical protein
VPRKNAEDGLRFIQNQIFKEKNAMTVKRFYLLSGCTMLFFAAAIFGLFACGGSSGGGSGGSGGGKAELSEARVVESLTIIEDTVPGCQVTNTSMAAAPVALMKSALDNDSALSNIRNMSAFQLDEIAGDCGGTLSIDSEHKSGNTTYLVVFNNFCFYDEEAVTPQEVIINGKLKGVEEGTPSDSGPIISGMRANTEGKLTIQTGDETISISLDDLRVKHGNPSTWEPDPPTAANPDRLTIKQVSIDMKNQGLSHTLKNIEAEIHESGDNQIMEIFSGTYNTGKDYVDVYTTTPLVIDEGGNMTGGTIAVEGDGDIVTISRAPGTPAGVLELRRNGVKINKNLDCSEIEIPLLDMFLF